MAVSMIEFGLGREGALKQEIERLRTQVKDYEAALQHAMYALNEASEANPKERAWKTIADRTTAVLAKYQET